MLRLQFKRDLLIMGNQAADLDSAVSSFALAALLERINPEINIYPLLQGSPSDLKLKPEIEALFHSARISMNPEHFTSVFFDSDSLEETCIILVDHNEADTEESDHPIAGIVDHHQDSGGFPNLQLRDIRVCGSCASIISEYWEQSAEETPYNIRLLLAGAIALDTGYLDPAWGKTTELDRRQYETQIRNLKSEDRSLIKDLLQIKNNLSHLSMAEHLRRDYKDFPMDGLRAGISSIPLSQTEFFNPSFYSNDAVIFFAQQNCPDFLIIMHTVPEPFVRELSLYFPGSNRDLRKLLETALNLLKGTGLETLSRGRYDNEIPDVWTIYSQKNIKVSRKVLVPLLKDELTNQMSRKKTSPDNKKEST